jgi:hypothetical protein
VKAATIGIRVLADYSVWLKDRQHVERLQAMMLARKLPYFNTKMLTLNLANLKLVQGFRDFSYACELVG